jgi:hypothetical protein
MACVIGDTVEMTLTSDDEETDSEGDPHPLQQASPGSVLVEGSQDVHIGPRLTYNGPVTVNQIVQIPSANSGYNDHIQHAFLRQASDVPGSCTHYADPLSTTTGGNVTKHNACLATRSEQAGSCGNAFLTSTGEVPSSSLGRDTGYPDRS